MKILGSTACVLLLAIATISNTRVDAKKPSRSANVPPRRGSSGRGSSSTGGGRRPPSRTAPVSRRRTYEDEYDEEEEEEELGFPDDLEEEEEEEEEEGMFDEEVLRPIPSRTRRGSSGGGGPRRGGPPPKKARGAAPGRGARPTGGRGARYEQEDYYEEDVEDYDDYAPPRQSRGERPPPRAGRGRGPPPRRQQRGRAGGRRSSQVVPYATKVGSGAADTFTRGLAALRDSMPDPATIRNAAASSISAARETTSKLSSNVYREVKGLTSSELEQVMLKATRPDDSPVKGKHAERLVGVTYQISGRYDIYDAVLRKLWSKMTEKDWRTTIKALYVLHRFSADGAPEHAPALKARLRELRRTKDPKRKDKYFNSKQLLAGTATPENMKFRAFMSRYAHYVLLRVQCFGGMFDEISQDTGRNKSSKSGKSPKPITSTALRPEHLEAASMLLKAGVACSLKDGEECENTAIASERVASDLIGLTTAVAVALNRALGKKDGLKGADPALITKWCEFYSNELLPQTRSMVKKTSAKLDAYGLFLPSRMGTSVSQELLQKGLRAEEIVESAEEKAEAVVDVEEAKEEEEQVAEEEEDEGAEEQVEVTKKETVQMKVDEEQDEEKAVDEDEYDEYDYEELEEYYDDEEA